MEIYQNRNSEFTKDFTAGRLAVGDLELFTLEDEVREIEGKPIAKWKIKGKTAIPRGRYEIELYDSPKFGCIVPLLKDVPGFDMVEIHWGNKAEDTDGCLLVGLDDGNDSDAWLGRSKAAFALLIERIKSAKSQGERVFITVQ